MTNKLFKIFLNANNKAYNTYLKSLNIHLLLHLKYKFISFKIRHCFLICVIKFHSKITYNFN